MIPLYILNYHFRYLILHMIKHSLFDAPMFDIYMTKMKKVIIRVSKDTKGTLQFLLINLSQYRKKCHYCKSITLYMYIVYKCQ